ncbi:META domain-containing protein [Agromyces intestinalis]|uniref:META domain-containing protein n=1 Tax=Agromyces intestinalis TaxID=2592652 RepID=UPI001FE91C75|nr:META domain-containing protein [Agromyces intestinalis]
MWGNRSAIVTSALVAAAAAALALAGCAGAGSSGGQGGDPIGTWGDPAATGEPWLSLADDGVLTGNDGCNSLRGTWERDDDGIVDFSGLAATRMFCQGVDTWLSGAEAARIDGDTMTVLGDDDAEIGTLARTSSTPTTVQPTPAAAGEGFIGTWGTDATGEPFLVIADDGTVTGSDGCNRLTGTWEPDDGGGIEFEGVASTLMACEGVDQSLNRLDSATVDGDTLTVLDDDDVVLVTLTRTA